MKWSAGQLCEVNKGGVRDTGMLDSREVSESIQASSVDKNFHPGEGNLLGIPVNPKLLERTMQKLLTPAGVQLLLRGHREHLSAGG